VLNEKLNAAASQLVAVEPVTTPKFDCLEGPKATRAAFFGLVDWLAGLFKTKTKGAADFVFHDMAFLALFVSLAVDLGIVFLTLVREAPARRRKPVAGAAGQGQPTPPRLSSPLARR
jgi:hypothetical protein